MNKYVFVGIIAASMLIMHSAGAVAIISCHIPPSCEELGYTDVAADCEPQKAILKCPFDENKVFCQAYKFVDCANYIGLYSDLRCYKNRNNIPEGVEQIGVVFDEVNRIAVSPEYPKSSYNNTEIDITWQEAIDFCAAMDVGGLEWRLPTVAEYEVLYEGVDELIEAGIKIGQPGAGYWSADEVNEDEVYTVDLMRPGFGYGPFEKASETLVRCVASF